MSKRDHRSVLEALSATPILTETYCAICKRNAAVVNVSGERRLACCLRQVPALVESPDE